MSGKIYSGLCMLVVVLFFIQPIASIPVGQNGANYEIINSSPDIEIINDKEANTLESLEITKRIVPKKSYIEQMQENRKRLIKEDPNVPVPDFDYSEVVKKLDDLPESSKPDYDDYKPKMIRFGTESTTTATYKTRAAATDLEITQMEWESKVNSGWGHYTESDTDAGNQPGIGGFMVGETTRITVRITNNNPLVSVSNVNINFSIYDYYVGTPLIKIPTQVSFSITGNPKDVHFDFTPPAACILYVAAYISYPDDTDTSNNGVGWYGMRTVIWAADLESGGYGDGSQTPNTWTGDMGTTNQWHKTDSAQNQNGQDHTTDWSYFHGDETGVTDTYDDSVDIVLESPKINMGQISDGQDELGNLRDGYYYIFAVPTWGAMYTGEAELTTNASNSDVLWCYEYTDEDPIETWKEPYSKYNGGYVAGNWGTQGGTAAPGWHPNSFPLAMLVGDGSGGVRPHNGATNWTRVYFRLHFIGDNGGDITGPGYYADDFLTWGYQHWLPSYWTSLREVTNLKSDGIPMLYPDVEASFEVTVRNYGEPLSDVPVKVEIKDVTGAVVDSKTKNTGTLQTGEEADVPFTWTPTNEGDYYIKITAGDLTKEYTPNNNEWELKVYVRNPNGRILLVDDDNSINNYGVFYKNVEEKMITALDDLAVTYGVYTVGWNETGPEKTTMDNYEAVIWMTGLDNEHSNYGTNPDYGTDWGITLKPEDQAALQNYLNQGDKLLWLISPGVVYDLTDTDSATTPTGFLKDYLHIIYCNANESTSTSGKLVGAPDTLAEGAEYDCLSDNPPPNFSDKGSVIEPDPASKGMFYQNTARTAYNSIQYSGKYKLAFFAFNYYYIEEREDRKDITYRVLNFFGIQGGIKIKLDDEPQKKIKFGETKSFKFKVTNSGLRPEKINFKLESPIKIPSGWAVTLNDEEAETTLNELILGGEGSSKYIYLNVTAPSSYLDKDCSLDTGIKNISWGSQIQFKVRAESKMYPDYYYDYASAKVEMGLDSHISLKASKTSDTIDISTEAEDEDHYVEYTVYIKNVTNGEDDVDVLIKLDNPTDLQAEVLQYGTDVTDTDITLPALVEQELSVRVYAEEGDSAGDNDIVLIIMDESDTIELNRSTFTTTVAQYYDVELETVSDESYSRMIDINKIDSDTKVEEFEVTLSNYGNGADTVTLEWVENEDSPERIPINWENTLVEIYDKNDDTEEIDEITVPAYDGSSDEPGAVTLLVKISVPEDEEEIGRYWIDIKATSSASKSYINNNLREDFTTDANLTFQIEIVAPELSFDSFDSHLEDENGDIISELQQIETENTVKVVVKVTNTGTGPVEDLEVNFTVKLNNLIEEESEEEIDLLPGENKKVTWVFSAENEGLNVITVKIDPEGEVLGDTPNGNTWESKINVKKPDEPKEPPQPVTEGSTSYALIIVIIVAAVLIVAFLFLFMRKKKKEGEVEDIVEETPARPGSGAPPERSLGVQPQPGQIRTTDVAALSPGAAKQLPPGSDLKKLCVGCGEKNPEQNKFCQSCGGKL